MLLFAFFGILGMQVFAQKTITGTVTSVDDGSNLPGVSVLVKGTNIATVTDMDGMYTLKNVPNDATTLVFSLMGMETQEVTIGGDVVDCALAKKDVEITGVVITALGMSKDEKSIGYSATNVGSEEFEENSNLSVMNSLQGKVAGVQVTSGGGSPGASTRVIIRGYSSITGGNNPLYVIDGVPISNGARISNGVNFGNPANDINPDDIKNMTILKGAAATAQYGPRGANGVVMITTKKGALNQGLSVVVNSSFTTSDVLRLPAMQNVFGEGWSGHFSTEENGSWGPKLDGQARAYGNVYNNTTRVKLFEAQPDNLYDFYEFGQQLQNSVSVSGGDDMSTFYVSFSNKSDNGVLPGKADVYGTNSLRANASRKGKFIDVSISTNYVRTAGNNTPDGYGGSNAAANIYSDILQVPRDYSIVDMKDYKDNPFNTLSYFYTPYAYNPYYSIAENQNKFSENRFYGNLSVVFNITKELKFTYRPGIDMSSFQRKNWEAIVSFEPGSPNGGGTATPNPGLVAENTINKLQLTQDFLLNYSHTFGDFSLDALAGFQTYSFDYKSLAASINGLVIPYFYDLSNSGDPQVASTYISQKRIFAYFAQADLSYKNYAYLTLTGRQDHSSTLPIDNNSFIYPSVSTSILLNNILDLNKDVFDLIKIRASWGKAGNDAAPYLINPYMVSSQVYVPFGHLDFPLAGVGAYEVSNQIGNLNLKPEITTEEELGFDIGMFKSRVNIDAAIYNRISDGQILPLDIATTSGYSTQIINFGKVQNKGLEVLASFVPVKKQNFAWDFSVNFTKNINNVLELPAGASEVFLTSAYDVEMVAIQGQPLGVIRALDYTYDSTGHVVCNAANGMPVASTEKTEVGTIQPDYILGFTNGFTVFGARLSFTLDYRPGGYMYSGTADLNYFAGNAPQTVYNNRQPFLVPNSVVENRNYDPTDPTSKQYLENSTPVNVNNYWSYFYTNNDALRAQSRVIPRGYMKLRNVNLSYSLPSNVYSVFKNKVKDIQIVLSGNNLLLWTPAENNFIDPESTSFGNDLNAEFGEFRTSPTLRSFTASIRVKF